MLFACLEKRRRRRRKDRERERDNNNDKKVWTGGSAELAEGLQMVLRTSFYFLIYSFARSLLDVVGGGGWGAGDEAGLIALDLSAEAIIVGDVVDGARQTVGVSVAVLASNLSAGVAALLAGNLGAGLVGGLKVEGVRLWLLIGGRRGGDEVHADGGEEEDLEHCSAGVFVVGVSEHKTKKSGVKKIWTACVRLHGQKVYLYTSKMSEREREREQKC